MKQRKIKIRGKTWSIIFGRPPVNNCIAYCRLKEHKIWVRPSQNKTTRGIKASIIHEILHASLPDLSEDAVIEIEEALMEGLELLD